MMRSFFALALLLLAVLFAPLAPAQTPAPAPDELLTLSKKIDEQNLKIDALSQHILKLEQMIEENKNAAAPATVGIAGAEEGASATPSLLASGNTHIVTRGETLTSIAKQYKVSIDELQKFNHIEDARKLQLGQKLMIPGPAASSAASPVASPGAPSPTTTPNE